MTSNRNKLKKIFVLCIHSLGWLFLIMLLTPSSASESAKEYLHERDDRLRGEVWDLHFCSDNDQLYQATISYPESTIVLHHDPERPSGDEYVYRPGRGVILDGYAEGPFMPPGNAPTSGYTKSWCTGIIGYRGYFPDSLRISIQKDSRLVGAFYYNGIKHLAGTKERKSNRTRITFIYTKEKAVKILVSERPRISEFPFGFGLDEMITESLPFLLWRAFIP
ncbi:MAG: hypothetical protein IPN71_02335 [Fibrobacteres bacterium]|nr:hypothetical protein [Fibrobacterota bacterium]